MTYGLLVSVFVIASCGLVYELISGALALGNVIGGNFTIAGGLAGTFLADQLYGRFGYIGSTITSLIYASFTFIFFALEAAMGAPPDAFNPGGQNWGLPPLIPERLRQEGYRLFIADFDNFTWMVNVLPREFRDVNESIYSAKVNEGATEEETVRAMAWAGLERRMDAIGADAATRTRYGERLEYELGVIAKMGFSGYFLIVADFIQWAKDNGVPVGPGRGSGAGSLVAWSLKITDLDPLRWGLLFERFLNPERVSMPDFDIDFCQDKRDQVIRYVRDEDRDKPKSQSYTVFVDEPLP